MTTLSLIIPVRGRIPLVLNTLRSVEQQTRRPDKLFVVDNANAPEDFAALRAECQRLSSSMPVEIVSCTTPGAPAARNAGLKLADTEWTMFFDSDDVMLPSHIASAIATAEANPDADIVGWDCALVNQNGDVLRKKTFPSSHFLFHSIMHGSLATQCYMARTQFFNRAGGWNPDATIWNDVETSVRLLSLNPTIVKSPSAAPNVLILTHPDSITGSDFSSRAADRDHTIDILIEYSRSHPFCGSLLPILALKRAILAGCCYREGDKSKANELYTKALHMPISTLQRIALRFAFRYTALSLRGVARILSPFF